jgi:alpha-ketoglutarate-dependent taurine dioxygenase
MSLTLSDRPMLLASQGRPLAELAEDEVWHALAVHGAVLFRGFPTDADGFYAFASRFNRGFLTSPFGDRKPASDRNELQTVTVGQAGLSLHFEYGNMPLRPDLLWFYCRRAAAEGAGGETLVADGVSVFERLRPATQAMLLARRVKYRNYLPADAFEAVLCKNEVIGRLVGGDIVASLSAGHRFHLVQRTAHRVVFEFIAPAVLPVPGTDRMTVCQNMFADAYKKPIDDPGEDSFSAQVSWENGEDIEREVLEELKQVTRSLTRGIRWRTGDFALIDNNRMLHGRNHTSDPGRDIVMLSSFSTRFEPSSSVDGRGERLEPA